MFEIEKNISVPEKVRRHGRAKQYPWGEMDVGDSFFVPDITPRQAASISGIAYKLLPKNLTPARRKECNGFRFWAIAKK